MIALVRGIAAVGLAMLGVVVAHDKAVRASELPVRLECRPAIAFFCANIHVSCAGRTRIRTQAFHVAIDDAGVQIAFEGSPGPIAGRLDRRGLDESRDLVIRLVSGGGRDWIWIEADGRYSRRIHSSQGDAMSHGQCTPEPRS